MSSRHPSAIANSGPSGRQPRHLLLCGLVALALAGCGGGSDDASAPAAGSGAGSGGSSSAPDLAALAGTYTLTTGGTVVGSLMLDQTASATICTLGSRGCAAEVTAPTTSSASTQFKLTATDDGSTANGAIASNGAVSGQLTKAGGAVEAFTGSKVSANFADCQSPFTRVNGQCVAPTSGIVLAPSIVWLQEIVPGGQAFTMQLCSSPLGLDCVAISDRIVVSSAELADKETADILDYAQSVAKEFQAMIGRLWAAKTYPTRSQLAQIFRNAVDGAIASDTQNAVQTAGAGFASAGFAAANGGTASSPSGTASSAESVCANQQYPGDKSEPQVYLFDKLAQFDACMYKATGNSDYQKDGNTQCRVLDGLLKATIGNFTPLYCSGPQLKS
jgi:hypothetical protein